MYRKQIPFLSLLNILFVLFLGIVSSGCRSFPGTVVKSSKLTPYWPQWRYLQDYMSDISLPALYTESSDQLQYCCVSTRASADTADPILYVDEKYMEIKQVVKNTKAVLTELMIQAYPDREKEIHTMIATWHVVIYGMKYVYVHPDSIRLHFENENCIITDTSWYTEGRRIVIGTVGVDSIVFISEDNLSEEKAALITGCFETRDMISQFGLAFTLQKTPQDYYTIAVRNIYYAIKTISPYVYEVHLSMDTLRLGKKYSFKGYNFSINDSRNDSRIYYINLDPPHGKKMVYCGQIGKLRAFIFDAQCIGTVQPERTAYGMRADITLSVLGIGKEQVMGVLD